MDTTVQLRPMTEDEFAAYRPRIVREYAAEHVTAGDWDPDDARSRSESALVQLLPDGLTTRDTLLLTVTDVTGAPVGLAWIALRHPQGAPDTAWVFDIEVGADHRGHGLGRRLYESAGYAVVTQQMTKRLAQ